MIRCEVPSVEVKDIFAVPNSPHSVVTIIYQRSNLVTIKFRPHQQTMSLSNCSGETARDETCWTFHPAVPHNEGPGDKSMNSPHYKQAGQTDKLFVRKPHSKAAPVGPVGPNLTIFCH